MENKKSLKIISLIEKKKNITTYQLSQDQVNAILDLKTTETYCFWY